MEAERLSAAWRFHGCWLGSWGPFCTTRSSAAPRWVSLQHPAHPSMLDGQGEKSQRMKVFGALEMCGNEVTMLRNEWECIPLLLLIAKTKIMQMKCFVE